MHVLVVPVQRFGSDVVAFRPRAFGLTFARCNKVHEIVRVIPVSRI